MWVPSYCLRGRKNLAPPFKAYFIRIVDCFCFTSVKLMLGRDLLQPSFLPFYLGLRSHICATLVSLLRLQQRLVNLAPSLPAFTLMAICSMCLKLGFWGLHLSSVLPSNEQEVMLSLCGGLIWAAFTGCSVEMCGPAHVGFHAKQSQDCFLERLPGVTQQRKKKGGCNVFDCRRYIFMSSNDPTGKAYTTIKPFSCTLLRLWSS